MAIGVSGFVLGRIYTTNRYNEIVSDIKSIERQLPKLKEENVFGGSEPEIFLETEDGKRFYFAIDGKSIEDYFSSPVVYR